MKFVETTLCLDISLDFSLSHLASLAQLRWFLCLQSLHKESYYPPVNHHAIHL